SPARALVVVPPTRVHRTITDGKELVSSKQNAFTGSATRLDLDSLRQDVNHHRINTRLAHKVSPPNQRCISRSERRLRPVMSNLYLEFGPRANTVSSFGQGSKKVCFGST